MWAWLEMKILLYAEFFELFIMCKLSSHFMCKRRQESAAWGQDLVQFEEKGWIGMIIALIVDLRDLQGGYWSCSRDYIKQNCLLADNHLWEIQNRLVANQLIGTRSTTYNYS